MATPWKIRRAIDLEESEQKAEHLGILAFTGAKNAHQLILTVLENDRPVTFASATNVMAYFMRAGEKVTVKSSVTANVITIRFPAAAYAIQTRVSVLVCAENTDEKVPLYAAVFDPGNGSEDVIIDPDDVIPDVSEMLAQIEAAREATAAANQAAANANAGETARNNAEASRVQAEKTRESEHDAAIEASETQTARAKAAADKLSSVALELETLPPSSDPTGSVEQTTNKTTFHLGIPASNFAYATFWIDPDTRQLMMRIPDGFTSLEFLIQNRRLVVRING